MKYTQETYDKIKTVFESIQSKKDLLLILNLAKQFVYGKNRKPFELKQLTYYANPNIGMLRYKEFKIKKKNGSERCINAPVPGLKAIQKTLSFILQSVYEPHEAAMGFVRSKSIVDNAKKHKGCRYVYNLDLKDYFSTIDQARVWKCLQLKPFSLIGVRLEIANMIAAICCTKMKVERKSENGNWEMVSRNVLPQGAPTSPVLSNIVCNRFDFILTGVAKRFGLNYSRYADDITFSSQHNVYQPESEFICELNRIITEQGFHIKESKTRLQKQGYRQEVTGLVVNENVNVRKRYIKELRMWLYYWERYGYDRTYWLFEQQYHADKGLSKKSKLDMVKVISGKLDYLRMVKGGENELFLKLKIRYDALILSNKNGAIKMPANSLENILSIDNIEKSSTTTKGVPLKNSNKLRININAIDSSLGQIKLKRKIIIDKDKILPIEEFIDNNEIEKIPTSDIKNHRPKETKLFLSLFNNSEGLKYLTHKFNDGKRNYDDFIELCKFEFDEGKTMNPNVPDPVLRRIEEFAFSPIPEWFIRKGDKKIFPRKGWAESSFIEWYKKDINMHPGFDSKWNTEMIVPFKESIEVRAGNLKTIIEEVLITGLGTSKSYFNIDLNEQNINTAEFYTDVDKIKLALSHILSTIKDWAEKNFCYEIKFDFINESLDGGNFKKVIITHINSEASKHSNDKDFAKGDMKTIQSNLWGLCNYEIEAKFPDGFRKKILLTDDYNEYKNFIANGESIPIINTSNILGFTHILKFY